MLKVPSLQRLINELSKLSGVGQKSAQRMAMNFLKFSEDDIHSLREALKDVKEKIHLCKECFAYTEEEVCHYCQQSDRDKTLICVVENPEDIDGLESSGAFKGIYHVLHGVIAPLEGAGPENLKIAELIHKVSDLQDKLAQDQEVEVILALDADLEGDTTSLYLAKELGRKGANVSRLAQGVPIGGDLDFVDHRTLGRALQNRIRY